MNLKRMIITLTSFIFIILLVFFLYFQYYEMISKQNDKAYDIQKKIKNDLSVSQDISDSTIAGIQKNFLFAVWYKGINQTWTPIIYDKSILSKENIQRPDMVPDNISFLTRIFPDNIDKTDLIFWINKYNFSFFLTYIILTILFFLLFYFITLLIIEFFFQHQLEFDNEETEFSSTDNLNLKKNKNENLNISDEYKNLWIKNFKISTDFKEKFPFKKIFELVKFGIKPEEYIKEALHICLDYFKWQNPKIYIFQKNCFLDAVTKDILNESRLAIPVEGSQKGGNFIPLFPYNSSIIYGYFYFEWNNNFNFNIADIIYFLKFLFSDRAKSIFINYSEAENIIDILKYKLEKKSEVFVAMLEVDNKEKILAELKGIFQEKLYNSIKEKISKKFKDASIFSISGLSLGILGETSKKENVINSLSQWMESSENQNYLISKDFGYKAVTFSCGVSFKGSRELHPLALINEAENNLSIAIGKGGNQIINN